MPNPFRSIRINDHRRRAAGGLMRLIFGKPAQPSGAPLPATGIYRILVCHVSHTLGNALLLTPLIQELEATYPGAQVDIVTRSQVAEAIYGRYFNVDRIFKLPSHAFGHPIRFWRELRGMRKTRYDLVIDPDPQSQTGRLLLLRANATWKLGFDSPKKSGNVTHAVAMTDAPISKGQRPVFLLRNALGRPTANPYPVPDIRLSAEEREQGQLAMARLLAGQTSRRRVIGIFANATGPKLLGADWWTPFLQSLETAGADLDIVEIVPAFGRSLLGSRYPAYYSGDLRKLASVLAALDGYTSADCGIMHLACAAGAATLGIFNTTSADEWGPYGPGNQIIRAYDRTPADVAREIAAIVSTTASI